MPSDKDIVVEAREMAEDYRRDIQPAARGMIRALADEVERLRRERKYWQTRADEASKAAEKWYYERY